MNNTRTLLACLLGLAASLQSQANAQSLTTEVTLAATPNLQRPIFLTSPPGDTSRLFVLEQSNGKIRIIQNGVLLPTPFLNIGAISSNTGGSQGLTSMAFHPDYASNGRFFVMYHDLLEDGVIAEFQVSASDPDVADPVQVGVIFGPVLQPYILHNLDHMSFGPDGMLYVATGDGGVGPNDTNNEAQDLSSLHGKIHRFDIDLPAPYIPASNPFVGTPGAVDSIYCYGLRQPWRFSFDKLTGDFYLGDVGEAQREELNFVAAGNLAGRNFGWSCLEGTRCTGTNFCDCLDSMLVTPLKETLHSEGAVAIIGGYVYRGSAMPWLQGAYFYSDYVEGKVRSLRNSNGNVIDEIDWTGNMDPGGNTNFGFFSSFGEDSAGELYLVSLFGDIFKIIESGGANPPLITSTCNGDGGDQMGCRDCPCGNNNGIGLPGGCLNSTGTSAELTTNGSIIPVDNMLSFDVTGASPGALAILVSANELLPANGACPPGSGILGMPALDGLRCVGFALKRHGGRQMDSNGDSGITTPHWGAPDGPPAGIIGQGAFATGQTRAFQAFYRDLPNLGCMTGQNTSNAIAITFGP